MKATRLLRQYRSGILDFKGASLHSAHLEAADLTRIDLTQADLSDGT